MCFLDDGGTLFLDQMSGDVDTKYAILTAMIWAVVVTAAASASTPIKAPAASPAFVST